LGRTALQAFDENIIAARIEIMSVVGLHSFVIIENMFSFPLGYMKYGFFDLFV